MPSWPSLLGNRLYGYNYSFPGQTVEELKTMASPFSLFVMSSANGHSLGVSFLERVTSEFIPSFSISFSRKPTLKSLQVVSASLPRGSVSDESNVGVSNSILRRSSSYLTQALPLSVVQNVSFPSFWTWPVDRQEDKPELQGGVKIMNRDAIQLVSRPLPNFSLNPGPLISSIVTSILVTYSLVVSDWWQFKHTAADRFQLLVSTHPATKVTQEFMKPIMLYLERFSQLTSRVPFLEKRGGEIVEDMPESDTMKTKVVGKTEGFIWEQREVDIEAEKKRGLILSPGFSFSAAGLLFPYHLGVSQCLIEHGLLKENTPLAGSSAGAIVCAVIASGVEMEKALEATKDLARNCRENGTAWRLGSVLREFLEEFLPEDAHESSNGRIRVAVTQVLRAPRGLLVDNFESREDLINSLITSSFVPGYLAPSLATRYRDRLCVDGGLSNFMPPTAAEETVRICAFPASSFGLSSIQISPDLNPKQSTSMRQLFNWALQPAEDDVLDWLFEKGYKDCLVWIQKRKGQSSSLSSPSSSLII